MKINENLFIPFIIESSVFSFVLTLGLLTFVIRRVEPRQAVILQQVLRNRCYFPGFIDKLKLIDFPPFSVNSLYLPDPLHRKCNKVCI